MTKKSYEMDMCSGPLLGKILRFALPLMLSGILQLLFNAADIVVVGQFAGHESLAAVGSTSSLINLLVNLFIGLSVGTNVLVARYYGAKREKDISDAVHTSLLVSVLSGLALVAIGVALARPLLELMGTPENVLSLAVLYMRIFFCGMPVMMLYNFGSAVLRAVGDTKRPLYFLLISGIINILLNLFFVIVCHMAVAGVALATVISQAVSALLVVRCLAKMEGSLKFSFSRLCIRKPILIQMIKIGLPAGMQGCVFSISNALIQSSINSFGSVAMAGNTAASNLEGFVYTSMNAVHQTALSFTSQNLGGRKYTRINKIWWMSLAVVSVIGLVMGNLMYLFGRPLLGIYSPDAAVADYGLLRMQMICIPYFLCGVMDVMVGSLRGMGYSLLPMFVSLTGACAFRVLWIYTFFAWDRTLSVLYFSYPVSWLLTLIVHGVCYFLMRRRLPKEDGLPWSRERG